MASARRVVRRHFARLALVVALCLGHWMLVRLMTAPGSVFSGFRALDIVEAALVVLVSLVLLANRRLVQEPQTRRVEAMSRQLAAANARLAEQARQAREELTELDAYVDDLLRQRVDLLGMHDSLLFQQDATASVQARLVEREAHYRSVVDSLSEGILLEDANGRILAWNASAECILGLSGRQLRQARWDDLGMPCMLPSGEAVPIEELPIRRALRTGVPQRDVVIGVKYPNGTVRWLSVNAQPVIPNGATLPSHAVASITDITETREAAASLSRLSAIVQLSEEMVVITSAEGRIVWANAAWCRKTGYALEEAVGQMPGALLDGPDTNLEEVANMRATVAAGARWSGELLNYPRSREPLWVELSVSPMRDDLGAITSFFSIERDITERRKAERDRQRFMAALEVTTDGVAITSDAGQMEFVNQAMATLHGYQPSELIGQHVSVLCSTEETRRMQRTVRQGIERKRSWSGTITSLRKDGTQFPADVSVSMLPSGGAVFALRDITEFVATQEALRTLSLRDELTGLYNRRGFFSVASQQLAAARRSGVSCLLVYGDLDRFKVINDTLGHDAGDQALKDVAQVLRESLRESDIVARLGGDEFTVLVVNASDDDEAAVRLRVTTLLDHWNACGGRPYVLSMSLGVARFDPTHPVDLDQLLRDADARLYANKATRRLPRAA